MERFLIDLCASLRAETKGIPASHIPRAHVLLCIYSDLTKVIRKDYLEQVDDLMYLSFKCMTYEFKMLCRLASGICDGQNPGKWHYLYPCAAMFIGYHYSEWIGDRKRLKFKEGRAWNMQGFTYDHLRPSLQRSKSQPWWRYQSCSFDVFCNRILDGQMSKWWVHGGWSGKSSQNEWSQFIFELVYICRLYSNSLCLVGSWWQNSIMQTWPGKRFAICFLGGEKMSIILRDSSEYFNL